MSSTTGSLVDAQLQHLLATVEQHRDERCKALRADADAQAGQLLQRAWRESRARLHQAVLDSREQARLQLAAAQARQQTQLRARRQREDRALLDRAWQPLHAQLLQRWQQVDSRQQWIDALVQQARTTLIAPHWHIEHPGDWPEVERTALASRLEQVQGQAPQFTANSELDAGLRICADDACVDGSIAGLLRAREQIEAMMLAALDACRQHSTVESKQAGRRP